MSVYFRPLHSRNSLPVRKIKRPCIYKMALIGLVVSFKAWVLG